MPNQEDFAFGKTICAICNQPISKGGAAFTSHHRMHVRRNEAVEYRQGRKLLFVSVEAQTKLIEEHPYAQLGDEPLPGQPKGVWDITDTLNELKSVDPKEYYITSGEAVKKAEKLVKDAYALAVKARAFREKLKKARGIKKYLETAHDNNRLCVKCKDPRYKEGEAAAEEVKHE